MSHSSTPEPLPSLKRSRSANSLQDRNARRHLLINISTMIDKNISMIETKAWPPGLHRVDAERPRSIKSSDANCFFDVRSACSRGAALAALITPKSRVKPKYLYPPC